MRSTMILVVLLSTAACASTGPRADDSAHFARDVGRGTAGEVMSKVELVLLQNQFEIAEIESPPDIHVRTYWRDRAPFQDEMQRGITAAQIRAIVRARPRSSTGLELYSVDLTIEQRVRTALVQEWTHETVSNSARQYASRIADDLRRHLSVGVHR